MMRIWITVNTVADTALAVVGLGIAGYAISAKPAVSLLYYGVALVCVLCAIVGFCNLPVLHAPAREPVLDAQVAEAAGDGGAPEGPCQD